MFKLKELFLKFLLALSFFKPLISKSDALYASSPTNPWPSSDLKNRLKNQLSIDDGVGLGVSMVKRGERSQAFGLGFADLATKRAVDAQTVFAVASVSKIFIALAIMKLEEEGRIDLNDTLESLAPEINLFNPWQMTHPITVYHLLEHTTGIHETVVPWFDNLEGIPIKDILNQVHGPPKINWPPGETCTYSNYNYVLISYLIEKYSGMAFDAYIKSRVFMPLGMTQSTFRVSEIQPDSISFGYKAGQTDPVPFNRGFYRFAAGMWSSPRDLTRFLGVVLNHGVWEGKTVLSPQILDRLEIPKSSVGASLGLSLGHGPGAVVREVDGNVLTGHNGITDGYMAALHYNRSLGIGYAVLINSHPIPRSPSLSKIRRQILNEFFLRPLAIAEIKRDFTFHTDQLSGFYQLVNPRFAETGFFEKLIDVYWVESGKNGDLALRNLFGKTETYHHGRDTFTFIREGQHFPTLAAGKNTKDEQILFKLINSTYVKRHPFWPILQLFSFFLSVTGILACFIASAFLWLYQIVKRKDHQRKVSGLIFLGCCTVFFTLIGLTFGFQTSQAATTLNILSFSWSLLSILFPISSLLSLTHQIRLLYKEQLEIIYLINFFGSFFLCMIAAYLAYSGFIGMALWR